MVLYSAADLLWASRIKAVADAVGVPARPVRSIQMLDDRLGEGGVRGLLLDLDAPERAWELLEHLGSLPEARASVRVVAFGPHVARDLLQSARERGADDVLTRGAFDHDLPELLVRLEAGASR